MNYYDSYVRSVRERTWFASDIEAVKAIRAVLEVLGRRITIGQADDLAVALPVDFRPSLRKSPGAASFGLDEFIALITEKEGTDAATADEHARAVLSALADASPRDELLDTLEQLPKEMRDLFVRTRKAA
jgi:uncharacterized protein (DUF2267 family)